MFFQSVLLSLQKIYLMGKRAKSFVIENLEIIDTSSDGTSVGKHENIAIFVRGAVPGDVVDVNVFQKKKTYYRAEILNFKKKSEHRVEPKCKHFGLCGGCKWQHLSYESQLKYKQKQVVDAFERIGNLDTSKMRDIFSCKNIFYYRNKLEFSFADRRWLTNEEIKDESIAQSPGLGFHVPRVFDKVLQIEECHLMDSFADEIRNAIGNFTLKENISYYNARKWEGLMRNIIVRKSNNDEWMLIIVFWEKNSDTEKVLKFVEEKFPNLSSIFYVINQKRNDSISDLPVYLYKGNEYLTETMEDLNFRVSPLSFLQTNSEQAYELYKIARQMAGLSGNELVYDLYTGTGTIAQFVAKSCKKVVGIEYVEMAIEDAKKNAKENNIHNAEFVAGDMAKVFTDEFVKVHGKPDIIITDPPRAGMHPDVVKQIIKLLPEKIIYVSCNPASQARDIDMLRDFYEICRIQPVDMFPHTHHVENICELMLKSEF